MELVCLSAGRVMYVRQELHGHEMSGLEVVELLESADALQHREDVLEALGYVFSNSQLERIFSKF